MLIVFVVLAGAALAIIPHADDYAGAALHQIIVTLNVIADPEATEVDPLTAHIPSEQVTTVVRDLITIPTTGKRGLPDSRASGNVIFVNQLNTPVTVGKGTAVRTTASSQAVRFILTEDVQVPGGIGAQAQGKVEAVELGATGNVPANFINEVEGVAALAVRVSNPEPLTGGGEKEVQAVASADRDTAREAIKPQLREAALQQLQAELGPGEFIIAESIGGTILEETFDHEITEQADQLTLLMRVAYTAQKVAGEDANRLVLTRDAESSARQLRTDSNRADFSTRRSGAGRRLGHAVSIRDAGRGLCGGRSAHTSDRPRAASRASRSAKRAIC